MTVLPDHEIKRYAMKQHMVDPYEDFLLQPASYDVRLNHMLRVPKRHSLCPIDLIEPETIRNRTEEYDLEKEGGFALYSGRFVLGSTIESVKVPHNIVGRIEGKSSIARLGLQIHCAGYLDPGFHGNVTVELVNFFDSPIILRPGVPIAQLSFEYMSSKAQNPYSKTRNHYQDSEGVVDSKFDEALEKMR